MFDFLGVVIVRCCGTPGAPSRVVDFMMSEIRVDMVFASAVLLFSTRIAICVIISASAVMPRKAIESTQRPTNVTLLPAGVNVVVRGDPACTSEMESEVSGWNGASHDRLSA